MALGALSMNIGGSEWAIIILMGLVLLFGSKKLPELSRAMGKAVGEYEKAREIFRKEMDEAAKAVDPKTHFMGPAIEGPVNTEREKLESIATSLGIDCNGKTDDQLRVLISQKIQD